MWLRSESFQNKEFRLQEIRYRGRKTLATCEAFPLKGICRTILSRILMWANGPSKSFSNDVHLFRFLFLYPFLLLRLKFSNVVGFLFHFETHKTTDRAASVLPRPSFSFSLDDYSEFASAGANNVPRQMGDAVRAEWLLDRPTNEPTNEGTNGRTGAEAVGVLHRRPVFIDHCTRTS